MTDHLDCPLCADMRALSEAIAADIAAGIDPGPPWNDRREEQIAHASDTYDPETGRSRPLRPQGEGMEENPDECPTCHGIGLIAVFEGDVPVDERCGACGGTGERSEW